MFKAITIYRIAGQFPSEPKLNVFVPCGPTQPKSIGWVPPRGHDHGELCEFVSGQHILKLMIETKKVPADVLDRAVDAACESIEQQTGRKPGKKQRKEIKEDVTMGLLPHAFPKRTSVFVWIDQTNMLLVIGSASSARCDDVATALVDAFEGMVFHRLNTKVSPEGAMAAWLMEHDAPLSFTIDRECELKAADESGAVVKYGRHPLDIDEIHGHIREGKIPTKLALAWDDRVSFVLTDSLVLKKVEMLEAALLGDKGMTLEDDAFDADVAIATGELSTMIQDLMEALGGEVEAAKE